MPQRHAPTDWLRASWQRSADHGVDPQLLEPGYRRRPGRTLTETARIAIAAIEDLSRSLSGESVALVLSDDDGEVVHRWCPDADLRRRLDGVGLAPGFRYSEASVGTNGIGTALATGAPTLIEGTEHFAAELDRFACAGVPVTHPLTGRLLGVVDLTVSAGRGTMLMLPFVRTVAGEIEHRLTRHWPSEAGATLTELETLERDAIVSALMREDGNPSRAATRLGISRATIYRRIHQYAI